MLQPREAELYYNLIDLTRKNEAFYFQDFVRDTRTYRIFNYRLASYTDFLQPDAIECRGIMFEIIPARVGVSGVSEDEPYRLASRPMAKFFNLNENPITMDLDLSTVTSIELKADGSLMSSYLHDGQIYVKSKGALFSEQAVAANAWLRTEEARRLFGAIGLFTYAGKTVNLEWCSPVHRIVLGYEKPHLTVLNVIDNVTGVYVPRADLEFVIPTEYLIKNVEVEDKAAFVQSIGAMTGIEGYVITLANGLRAKVKCEWYLSLHHAKDSVNNPRRLFEAILDEAIDDLRSMFFEDKIAMQLIDEMQVKVDHIYNTYVKAVEEFYAANKHLDRKSYAIKGQQELPQLYFGTAMNLYVQKLVNYKEFLKGKWKDLGLKDTAIVADEE